MIQNITLLDLIATAYEIGPSLVPHVITGGPGRILATRFDINARPPEGAPASATLPMLRSLLADRFKLKVHREKRNRPVYALVIANEGQLGPQLRRSELDCDASGARTMRSSDGRQPCRLNVYQFGKPGLRDLTISDSSRLSSLIMRIQSFVDRPLVDATGLTGNFEWSLSFATSDESTTAPVIYSALQEQLGIRAERRSASFDALVIESVEMPTPN